jgi:pyruvate/2-oxoglutarate/acetoin dehydrogenase E1 component
LCEVAVKQLAELGIEVELIDCQTLLPFDINHMIKGSLQKTNRLLIVDEDVSSGATGFILDKILVEQQGYYHLDSAPETMSAKDHRPAYGSDGDYFSKPSVDDIVEKVYAMMNEVNPQKYPSIY